MKVRCKRDFGFFKAGEVYSVFRFSDILWKVFFNDKDEMIGGARDILEIDLRDFFSRID